jgi:hypothetical protein
MIVGHLTELWAARGEGGVPLHSGHTHLSSLHKPVLGIRIRRIRMFLDFQDPDRDPLVRDTAPDPDQAPDLSNFS